MPCGAGSSNIKNSLASIYSQDTGKIKSLAFPNDADIEFDPEKISSRIFPKGYYHLPGEGDVHTFKNTSRGGSPGLVEVVNVVRSEERRVGKEWGSRWAPYPGL